MQPRKEPEPERLMAGNLAKKFCKTCLYHSAILSRLAKGCAMHVLQEKC